MRLPQRYHGLFQFSLCRKLFTRGLESRNHRQTYEQTRLNVAGSCVRPGAGYPRFCHTVCPSSAAHYQAGPSGGGRGLGGARQTQRGAGKLGLFQISLSPLGHRAGSRHRRPPRRGSCSGFRRVALSQRTGRGHGPHLHSATVPRAGEPA